MYYYVEYFHNDNPMQDRDHNFVTVGLPATDDENVFHAFADQEEFDLHRTIRRENDFTITRITETLTPQEYAIDYDTVAPISFRNANLHTRLNDTVEEAYKAGLKVYAVQPDLRPTGFIYIARDLESPFVTVSTPINAFELVQPAIPVRPNREWGSSILVDGDTPIEAVLAGIESWDVRVRFIPKYRNTFVKNIGKEGMQPWLKAGKIREVLI